MHEENVSYTVLKTACTQPYSKMFTSKTPNAWQSSQLKKSELDI